MMALHQTWLAIVSLVDGQGAGLFVLAFAGAAIAHTAVGLGRTRQWYMLPVIFGLTALAGFVLNPFADANTPAELRRMLTSYETLTLLCIVQFLLLATALFLGIRLDPSRSEARGAIALVVVHAVPGPVVVVAMLLVEQARLAQFPGARPEWVGREVGFIVAGILVLICLLAMGVPRGWLAVPHQALSLGMVLACAFVPVLHDPLPEPMARIDLESIHLLWKVGLGAAALVLVGCCWPRQPGQRRSDLRLRAWKSMS